MHPSSPVPAAASWRRPEVRSMSPPLPFAVVILAAGASSRMGQPKMLLPWGKTSVLGHLILQWRNAGAEQIAVVLAPENRRLQRELDRLSFPPENRISN